MEKEKSRWFIVVLGFIALGLAFSTRSFLGLSMPEWEAEFGWSKSSLSGGGAIALVIMAAMAPFVGHAVDRFGAKPVLSIGLLAISSGSLLLAVMANQTLFFIAFSGVSAFGFGLVSMHAIATSIAPAFDKNRGLATGIASGGATGGQMLFVPLFSIVLSWFGWRTGYVAMAIVTLSVAALLWWVLNRFGKRHTQHVTTKTIPDNLPSGVHTLIRSPVFHALFWSFTLCGFTTAGVIETHFLPYASICGYTPITSATAYGLLSAFNLFGMILAGYLSDRFNGGILLFGIYSFRAISFILLLFIGLDIKLLFLFAVFFGLFDYSTVPVTANLVVKHLGLNNMGLVMGTLAMGHALGAASGAYLGGVIFDYFTSYSHVWTLSSGLAFLAALIVLFIPAQKTRNISMVKPV